MAKYKNYVFIEELGIKNRATHLNKYINNISQQLSVVVLNQHFQSSFSITLII